MFSAQRGTGTSETLLSSSLKAWRLMAVFPLMLSLSAVYTQRTSLPTAGLTDHIFPATFTLHVAINASVSEGSGHKHGIFNSQNSYFQNLFNLFSWKVCGAPTGPDVPPEQSQYFA